MKLHPSHGRRAFTVFEALVVVAFLGLLAAVLLPLLAAPRHRPNKEGYCVNNLKQVGLAYRIWAGDHGDKYPMFVPVAQGGAQELFATGNVAACFQVMSNELSTPKIIVCPGDSRHTYATNFGVDLTPAHLGYFIGSVTNDSDPQSLVSGDANLVQNGHPLAAGIFNSWTNPVTWTKERHQGSGYILVGDGSVQAFRQIGFPATGGSFAATNLIVIP